MRKTSRAHKRDGTSRQSSFKIPSAEERRPRASVDFRESKRNGLSTHPASLSGVYDASIVKAFLLLSKLR